MDERTWKVGELADAAGVTVRTLHHFDEIGLLRPSRSASGHRLYTDADVSRLYQVLALRDLGLSLREVAASLDGDPGDLAGAVHRHLIEARRRAAGQLRVCTQLEAIQRALAESGVASVDLLIQAMEAMMKARYFTDDQLTRLRARHDEAGPGAFADWQRRWADLDTEARGLAARGLDPADDAAQDLAVRWSALMRDMTGGDRAILSAMYAKLDGKGAEAATMGVVSTEGWTYVKRALALGHPAAATPSRDH